MNRIKLMSIIGGLLIFTGFPAHAAGWEQEGENWKYQNDDDSYAKGWNWIAGKSYYFDEEGNMLSDTVTPDGYQVNENGEWVSDGIVQTQGAQDSRAEGYAFGSKNDAAAKGYWSDTGVLTWTWWSGSDGNRSIDGESVVIGNGPKYSDLHPEITDREHLLKEYVNYPGEGLTNLSSWGEPKANYDEETLQLLREFVNSFDWIHSDELTRMKAVHNRIAVGKNGNRFGTEGITREYNGWSVLRDKGGVCMNYAGEFRRLAQYVGLECVEYSPRLNHETCMVKINGQWITVDPSVGLTLFNNLETVPVDFDVEHSRSENEYKESDAGKRIDKLRELNRQLEQGEISEEEFEKEANSIWNSK